MRKDSNGEPHAAKDAAPPIAVEGPRGPVRLKWHKLRTDFGEAPFKPANLAVGWRLGASLEVDVLEAGDGRFAVLHDLTLGPSTTGTGRVSRTAVAAMAGLMHRDRAGNPDPDAPVLSLADLVRPLATLPRAATTVLQLDLKTIEGKPLSDAALADAAAAVAGIEDAIVIGSMDLREARRLAAATPGARLGYDPQRLVERAHDLAHAPERLLRRLERHKAGVTLAYLYHPLVLAAAARKFPLIDRLLDLGIETDAWTVNPGPGLKDEVLASLLHAGVRQITTDDPRRLARHIAALG